MEKKESAFQNSFCLLLSNHLRSESRRGSPGPPGFIQIAPSLSSGLLVAGNLETAMLALPALGSV